MPLQQTDSTVLQAAIKPSAYAFEQTGFGVLIRLALAMVFAVVLGGCAALPRNALPPHLVTDATLPNLPDVRAWAGRPSPTMERDMLESFAQESETDFPRAADGSVRYAHLALSGGGANGAFGAGFLSGWTQTGSRPTFKIVTGVSTGALMAPFAFIGADQDPALRDFYTTTRSRDIFILGSLFAQLRQLLAGEALADTRPLIALIEQHVNADLLRGVAEAHRRGRRLFIGTTDLDSRRFVVWNMGLIATSDRPEALDLFRKVMLASASIPVAFPPVLFQVEAGGRLYDEMHVDGGVGARVFLNVGLFRSSVMQQRGGRGAGREDIFVIHNGQLIPEFEPVPRSLPSIALRVLDAAGRAAVVGDLFRIYNQAHREGAGFHWITIPNDVSMDGDEVFDPVKMRMLYDVGHRIAKDGNPWATLPPGRQPQDTP